METRGTLLNRRPNVRGEVNYSRTWVTPIVAIQYNLRCKRGRRSITGVGKNDYEISFRVSLRIQQGQAKEVASYTESSTFKSKTVFQGSISQGMETEAMGGVHRRTSVVFGSSAVQFDGTRRNLVVRKIPGDYAYCRNTGP